MGLTIAISRQFGSGGAVIGRAVAAALGYRYADREILAEAARLLDVDPAAIEPLDEQAPSFWSRIGEAFAYGTPDMPSMPPGVLVTESDVLAAEQAIIRRLAVDGGVVIVGRGAAHVLESSPRVLRVFLHAPLPARVSLAMREHGIADEAEATAAVVEADKARAKLARSVAGREWHDATLYDVCLDTDALGIEAATDVLLRLARARETGGTQST